MNQRQSSGSSPHRCVPLLGNGVVQRAVVVVVVVVG